MSEKGHSKDNGRSSRRKAKDIEKKVIPELPIKKLHPSSEKGKPKVEENRVVLYKKNYISGSESNSSEEEEKETKIIPFATDISANPLSTYNTFVCHLGDWKTPLHEYLKHKQFRSIFDFVKHQYDIGTCFPPKNLIFNAFQKTRFNDLKVVVLGSAPSAILNHAMGLSYSSPRSVECSPTLQNVYKALVKDPKVDFTMPNPMHGDLTNWTGQGVLMLNNSLTTQEGKVSSHAKAGWKFFTKAILDAINKEKEGVIFLSWGGQSLKILKGIDKKKHHVLTFSNPSPLSEKYQKFEDCTHFSDVNKILKKEGKDEIDWNLD